VAAFQYHRHSEQQKTFGKKFAQLAGCSSLANLTCLRGLPADKAIGFGEKAVAFSGASIIDRILEGGACT
jgi:hypothetical protein